MKKRNLVKIFILSLCLTTIVSTVAFAKDNNQYKFAEIQRCSIDSHPIDVQFPD